MSKRVSASAKVYRPNTQYGYTSLTYQPKRVSQLVEMLTKQCPNDTEFKYGLGAEEIIEKVEDEMTGRYPDNIINCVRVISDNDNNISIRCATGLKKEQLNHFINYLISRDCYYGQVIGTQSAMIDDGCLWTSLLSFCYLLYTNKKIQTFFQDENQNVFAKAFQFKNKYQYPISTIRFVFSYVGYLLTQDNGLSEAIHCLIIFQCLMEVLDRHGKENLPSKDNSHPSGNPWKYWQFLLQGIIITHDNDKSNKLRFSSEDFAGMLLSVNLDFSGLLTTEPEMATVNRPLVVPSPVMMMPSQAMMMPQQAMMMPMYHQSSSSGDDSNHV